MSKQKAALAGGVAGLLALSGCGMAIGSASTSGLGRGSSKATVIVTPGEINGQAAVDAPITVIAQNGHLTDIAVTGPKGEVAGAMNDDRTAWTSGTRTLAFGTTYTIKAQALDAKGKLADITNELTTITPSNLFSGQLVNFSSGQKVGVGMPVRIEFSRPIKNLTSVEPHLQIRASKPVVGAWSWDADRTAVTFRPKTYWPANTSIRVAARLRGANAGGGVYGDKDLRFKFSTGSAMLYTIDAAKYQMVVTRADKNGKMKVVRTAPVTTGRSGFETRSGTKVMMAKEGTIIMDAATGGTPVGSPDYYRLTVNYSIRVTPSGEYMHAAPWSTGSQGRANVSHGCIGMSTSNAIWMWNNSSVGDVVVVKNTGRKQDLGNGITDWNISWPKWLKRSKLGAQEIGPDAPDTVPAPPAADPTTPTGPAPTSSKKPYAGGTA